MTVTYRVGSGLYVNLTNKCPCACTFCIRQNGDGVYGSDSLWLEREPTADETCESIERNLGDASELVFCGYGEPTERLDVLLEVAGRFKEVHPAIPIRVNTNGLADLIVGEPTASRFKGIVDTVSISLNAPTAEEYVALCHPKFGAAAYPALLKFAEEVKRFVPNTLFTVVGTESFTPEKEAACRKVAADRGIPLRVRRFTGPQEK